ncbi:MAG: hypothetical protein ACYTFA_15610 [Planctomycetota bacterium]|jgi:hypothetical protein
MPAVTSDVEKALTAIIEALDAAGENTAPDSAEHRGELRRLLRARCELWTCDEEGRTEAGYDIATRNVSFHGLSVVGNLHRPLRTGRPIEAVITMPDLTRRYLAGTVAFCRQVRDECYEVGIYARAVGSGWIVAGDVKASISIYDWFAKALQVPE